MLVELITFGIGAFLTNAAKAGAWDVVTKAVLKTMAVDAAGSSIAYVTGAALQEMGLPAGTATVLAAIVSGGITYSAGRYFLKDEAGNVIAEYTGAELDRILKGEMDGLERSGLSAIKGIDNLDSLDGVMIKYKDGKYVISDAAGKEISATGKELDDILKGSAGSVNGSSITFKITDIDALKGGTATYRNGKYIICDATGKEIQECTVTELEKILKGEVKSVEGLLDIPEVLKVNGEGGSQAIKNALPNVENATINPKKLTEYALNPDHPVGGNKAKVFESALGYNQSNADDLMRQIYEKLPNSEAVLGTLDEYGQRYTVDILISGPNGNTVNVRTGWIIKTGSDVPELTTLFVND